MFLHAATDMNKTVGCQTFSLLCDSFPPIEIFLISSSIDLFQIEQRPTKSWCIIQVSTSGGPTIVVSTVRICHLS